MSRISGALAGAIVLSLSACGGAADEKAADPAPSEKSSAASAGTGSGFVDATCGALHLKAPTPEGEAFSGAEGFGCSWIGSGKELVAITVTVREDSQLTSAFGVRGALTTQLDAAAADMDQAGEPVMPEGMEATDTISGHPAAYGSVTGTKMSLDVLRSDVVTTDGTDLYYVDVVVTDTPEGRAAAEAALADLSF